MAAPRMFIDNPWDDVERIIADEVEAWMVDADLMRQARPEAEAIARRVMNHLDGGDYPSDKHGLRESA